MGDLLIFRPRSTSVGCRDRLSRVPNGYTSLYVDGSYCEKNYSAAYGAVFLSSCYFPICVEFGARRGGSASELEREAIINAAAIAVNKKWLPLTIYSDCNMILEGVYGLLSYVHTFFWK